MTLRCVCNLSVCASSNYMCKSDRGLDSEGNEVEGGCFTEEMNHGQVQDGGLMAESNGRPSTARRGCIQMLPMDKQLLCRKGLSDPIECCFNEDMCNYPSTFYPSNQLTNNQQNTPFNRNTIEPHPHGGMSPTFDHHIWLRAAVIAVPICGLLILLLLIYVARKLLRGEDKEANDPMRKVKGHSETQSQLLIPNIPMVDSVDLVVPCQWCSCSVPPSAQTNYLIPSVQPISPIHHIPNRRETQLTKFSFLKWKFGSREEVVQIT